MPDNMWSIPTTFSGRPCHRKQTRSASISVCLRPKHEVATSEDGGPTGSTGAQYDLQKIRRQQLQTSDTTSRREEGADVAVLDGVNIETRWTSKSLRGRR